MVLTTTTADGHRTLGEVRMAGSLLAALIKETGRRAKTHSEGLLLGATQALTVAVTDDATETTERALLQMDVTGYVCTGCRDSFYQPLTGVVKQEKVAEATAGTNGEHSVVGWFVARHCVTTKPSLRDLAILRQLGEYVNHQRKGQKGENGGIEEDKQQQEQQEGGCGGGGGSTLPSPTPWTPVVLIVFSLDLQPTSETQGVSYACHYLPPPLSPRPSDGFSRPAFHSLLVKVRAISHDCTAEYQTYTGGYHSSLLSPPSSSSSSSSTTTTTGLAGMPSMRPGLRELARTVPPPHVTEYELYVDQVLARLHALVDDIQTEEMALSALKEKWRQMRRVLREEKRAEGEKEGKEG